MVCDGLVWFGQSFEAEFKGDMDISGWWVGQMGR